ncbi:hypothetical protein [uncultured Duncaniella sp.]|uniref:hypothetical protein n=1 Tax=uncultured Duncaniella sp. TaxID=2768039 RepID=UPI002614BA2B|nr:hypothetical protein [uncultured Duncaniella sp.]
MNEYAQQVEAYLQAVYDRYHCAPYLSEEEALNAAMIRLMSIKLQGSSISNMPHCPHDLFAEWKKDLCRAVQTLDDVYFQQLHAIYLTHLHDWKIVPVFQLCGPDIPYRVYPSYADAWKAVPQSDQAKYHVALVMPDGKIFSI